MAVVEFSIKDFESLVGRKLTKTELEETLVMMGFPLEKLEKENIFYEVFPNRPDMLSVEGFARSARFFLGIDKKLPNYNFKKSKVRVRIDKSVKDVRPCIACAVAMNVRLSDDLIASLMQVQEKLHDTLGRKRKKVAIGVHDFDRVEPPYSYAAVSPGGLSFVPLDMKQSMTLKEICKVHPKGVKYAHILEGHDKWPIITDSQGEVLSFPPIINGELTRVTGKTRNLFIDVTGTSQQAVSQALNIITSMLHERGASIETVEIDNGKKFTTPDTTPVKMNLDINYASKLLGISLKKADLAKLLMKMGIAYSGKALIPYYRADIMHPMDLVEEIAIAHGYSNFKPELPSIATNASRDKEKEFSNVVRESMAGVGFQEIIGMILTNEEDEFGKLGLRKEEFCETANSMTAECNLCRKRIIPSLLRALFHNKNKEYPQKIYEIGHVVFPNSSEETGASFHLKLGCAASDVSSGYEDISTVLDSFLKSMGLNYELKKADNSLFIGGRCAQIIAHGEQIGFVGEISPQILENWKLEKPVAAFEISLENIMKK